MNISNTGFHSHMLYDDTKAYVSTPGFTLLQLFGEGAWSASPTQSPCNTRDQLPKSSFSACWFE